MFQGPCPNPSTFIMDGNRGAAWLRTAPPALYFSRVFQNEIDILFHLVFRNEMDNEFQNEKHNEKDNLFRMT